MTDEYEENFPAERQYVPPVLHIAAVYQATDGRVPESIDIELNHLDVDQVVAAVDGIVAALARVADARMPFATGGRISAPIGTTAGRDHVYLSTGGSDVPIDLTDTSARAVAGVGAGATR